MKRPFHAITRRDWLRTSMTGLGMTGCSMSGWLPALAEGTLSQQGYSVIVLWMSGGPSTIDLWDLKTGHSNGGPFQEIETTAPGMKICEHLPNLAKHGNDLAIIRSMSTKEGDHERATYLLRTGYTPQAAIQFPALGSILTHERNLESAVLPNFVSVAPGRQYASVGAGFLGPHFAPLVIGEGAYGNGMAVGDSLVVPDLAPIAGISIAKQRSRLELLVEMENRFRRGRKNSLNESFRDSTARAVRLLAPEASSAFQLEDEAPKTRESYGRGLFGQGCLLARRLVERDVPFVEVTLEGWDTHQNNFERVKELSRTLDMGFSSLLTDLKDRGMLDRTLVVCQGEFGRTPRINGQVGRDHWPASWAVALAGGRLRTGQAIGRTNAEGTSVEDRPVSVPDLIATIATKIGIDPQKQNISNVGRPIRIAAPDAKPVQELL